MGTSDFAVPSLSALAGAGYPIVLAVTQPDKPAGRGLELKASPVKRRALELGLPVFQPPKIRAPEAVEEVQKSRPDVIVVAAYGQILPAAVLQAPRTACLNIHGSLLPKYRGAAPIHYAVMAGEKETGVTLMYMNEKMDEGDILLSKTTPIGPDETTGDLHDRLAVLGSEGLLESLELLAMGRAFRTPQDAARASYAPSLKREFCRLAWGWTAERIHNRIRGLSPWPGAETLWGDMELKVHRAEPSDRKGPAGEVLEVRKEGILVGAGVGSVLLTEIQPPGKKRMKAYDFTLGHPGFKAGERLS
jgi:methionyl-tRNA formyltransferase